MNDKTIRSMKRYLDDVYNDLECVASPKEVTWWKNGKVVAGVTRSNRYRLRLSSSEFYSFIKTFCLPWEKEEDNIILLMMIIPYLKFNGGSPAIPVLLDMGFIDNLNEIGLPGHWE
jgi:hypothetical protein